MRAGIQGGVTVTNLYVNDVTVKKCEIWSQFGFDASVLCPNSLRLTRQEKSIQRGLLTRRQTRFSYLDLPVYDLQIV